jgi:hypothetical protein
MLLPEVRDAAAILVAQDRRHQFVIGAGAVTRTFRPLPTPGPGIDLHVIEPCRRHGVGRELLRSLDSIASSMGARALYATRRVQLGSEPMNDWERLGFIKCETVKEHVLPLTQISARLEPLVERMRTQGRIPANARVVPLFQADPAGVLQLHLDYMGGDRAEISRKLRGHGAGAFLPRQSRVLLIDNEVKGCLLAIRVAKEAIAVDANIVESSLRGGWANAWLKLEAFRGAPPGVTEFRFTSFDHYADTRSFSEKLGGSTVRTTVLMMRPLDAEA